MTAQKENIGYVTAQKEHIGRVTVQREHIGYVTAKRENIGYVTAQKENIGRVTVWRGLLPPASAVKVIESEPCVCLYVCVCEHPPAQTVWPMTLMGVDHDLS